MRRRALAAAIAGACSVTAACASSNGTSPQGTGPAVAALSATQPWVQVAGRSAYLVWPSESAWLLLRSDDGFRTVDNRTPVAVETDGGLVDDVTPAAAAVAVGATERLYRSPLLTARGNQPWVPAELTGGVLTTRGAVALRPDGTPSAVVSAGRGTLLVRAGSGWRVATSGARLSRSGTFRLESIRWLSADAGVVTGTSPRADAPVAFRTDDGGTTWSALPGLPAGAVTALAPCRTASDVLLPVITRAGTEVVLRSPDGGASWQAGQRFTVAEGVPPAWGCSATAAWTVAHVPAGQYVLTSTDAGRSWHTAGAAPANLTSLAPVDAGDGYATSGGADPKLYTVDRDAHRFRRVPLPGWVSRIGSQMSGS